MNSRSNTPEETPETIWDTLERSLSPEVKTRIFKVRDRFRGMIWNLVKNVVKLDNQVEKLEEEIKRLKKEVERAKFKEELIKIVLEKE